jgi:rhodanese-related sulfurtransferase
MSTPREGRAPVVEPDEAMVLLEGDALMLDVRDAHEWAAGHAPHSVHIPLAELSASTPYTTRVRRVILVSRTGRRATDAAVHLRAAAVDAVVLHGGLRAWLDAGGELVAEQGHEPHLAAPAPAKHPEARS